MDLHPDALKVEQELLSDTITWREALDKLEHIRKKKSWHSPEWKLERDNIIKGSCEQCDSSKPPMVLQHFTHPQTFGQILRQLSGRTNWLKYKQEYDRIIGQDLLVERKACPKCKSTNIGCMESTLTWNCYKCHAKGIGEPIIKQIFTREGSKEMKKRRQEHDVERWRSYQDIVGDKYGKQALIEQFKQNRDYLSLEDTKTFCKKCAFAWDKKGLRICIICKENWTSILNTRCSKCQISISD